MAGPFLGVTFVVTVGIGPSNAESFLGAGAGAVSLGASFADADPAELVRALGGEPCGRQA